MAIEKMTFIDIKGDADHLDEVLVNCARCEMFHPENAAKLSEYSVGTATLLRNPYGVLQIKIGEIAKQLGITPAYRDGEDIRQIINDPDKYIEEIHAYLDNLRHEYPSHFEKKQSLAEDIKAHEIALDMLQHVVTLDMRFENLWGSKYLKMRIGQVPTSSVSELEKEQELPFEIHVLQESDGRTWCIYATADEFVAKVDELFGSRGFRPLDISAQLEGTVADALNNVRESLGKERRALQQAIDNVKAIVIREKERFLEVYSDVKFLHDAYDLRRYAVTIRGQFHVVGYVLTRQKKEFLALFSEIPTVAIIDEPAIVEGPIPVPVKLKNNWFVRPFEMFVNMYGSPSYNDIDPTPFVAYTYSFLFGLMFGDLGHGLCVMLLGMFLWKKRGMVLGAIMSRIGAAASFFGFCYGSVFGFEHLLDPFFKNVMGLGEKPIEVMHPDTTNQILIVAIGIGAVIIMMVILFNMLVGIRHRDFHRTVLSHNGAAGLVLYSSVLFAAVQTLMGNAVLTVSYGLIFIAIPLLIIFLQEPIMRFIDYRNKDSFAIAHDKQHSAQLGGTSLNIPELFNTQFMTARFGRIPIDGYKKLSFYRNEPFVLHPLKTDHEYIWCIYATAITVKDEIDAIFHDLYFERIYIPVENLESHEQAESFIKHCIDASDSLKMVGDTLIEDTEKSSKPKTLYRTMFPEGFGGFFTQSFFELFEVVLSFITNTMSFLRVGGFILVHAGMMMVVMQLSEMVGGGASPIVIIIGNIFVMGLEGLIVGIQTLRLEFYEIFSRFFDATGEVFEPFVVDYKV